MACVDFINPMDGCSLWDPCNEASVLLAQLSVDGLHVSMTVLALFLNSLLLIDVLDSIIPLGELFGEGSGSFLGGGGGEPSLGIAVFLFKNLMGD